MEKEIEELEHRTVCQVPIKFKVLPTMLDGKARVFWAGKTSMASCLTCGSTPIEMSQRVNKKFEHILDWTLKYGMSPMHLRVRTMEWCCKAKLYGDLESWYYPEEFKFLKANNSKISREFFTHCKKGPNITCVWPLNIKEMR